MRRAVTLTIAADFCSAKEVERLEKDTVSTGFSQVDLQSSGVAKLNLYVVVGFFLRG